MDDLERVARAAAKWDKAQEAYREAFERFASTLVDARDSGLPLRAIADAAGISHTRVANIVTPRTGRERTGPGGGGGSEA